MNQRLNPTAIVVSLLMVACLGAYAHYVAGDIIARAIGITTYALAGTIIVVSVALAGYTFINFVLLTLTRYEQMRITRANRLQAEKKAQVKVVTARHDEVVLVRDTGDVTWQVLNMPHALPKPTMPNPTGLLPPPAWPEQVKLLSLLGETGASLNHIILGVTPNGAGQLEPVAAPLHKLVHVGVGGSTGWGKSLFLQAFAYQVATASEPVEICLIDPQAVTFNLFAKCNRLRYPMARSESDIRAILADLEQELEQRSRLFEQVPLADNLVTYNQLALTPLRIITCFFDEATTLMEDSKAIERTVGRLVLEARKFGIFLILAGQEWSADGIRPKIRRQLSTKVHFHANDHWQSRALLGRGEAVDLDRPGLAFAVLPGRRILQILAPYISRQVIQQSLATNGQVADFARPAMPAPPLPVLTDKQREVLDLYKAGERDIKAIAKAVYGSAGGKQRELVEGVLARFAQLVPGTNKGKWA